MSAEPDFDLVVVGGGIHGVGVAQAAAAAGQRTLLLEERALAAGTSSRSSKLIHGGLRYLESGQWQLVRESLAERALLLQLAPKLVQLVPFFLPIYSGGRRRPWQIRAGLTLYATLGNLKREALFQRLPRREWNALDGLETRGLEAVFRYHDGQTDDAALVRAVAASARRLGATIEVGASLVAGRREDERWILDVRDARGERTLSANCVVNAAGPWVDEVSGRLRPIPPRPRVELVAGTHLELDGALERGIYYTEATDGRAVFHIPWKGHTLVGTTETPYRGKPADLKPTREEIDYLLATFARYFPSRTPKLLDSWAGARVLPFASSKAFDRPREVHFVFDTPQRPHFVAIYGGKLTGYRLTAEKALHFLALSLPTRAALAPTSEIPLEPAD
ncbi:MAG: FAD-dependent oxidoreductase [Planctomycetes bacterium]|nr:FAD-dependent oxidoreductase [Planctomycetota bacterium]